MGKGKGGTGKDREQRRERGEIQVKRGLREQGRSGKGGRGGRRGAGEGEEQGSVREPVVFSNQLSINKKHYHLMHYSCSFD